MLEHLKTQNNQTSARIEESFRKFVVADHGEELFTAIEHAAKADCDFVKEFESRAKKVVWEFLARKMKDEFNKQLTEAFSKM